MPGRFKRMTRSLKLGALVPFMVSGGVMAADAPANDFPTQARAEYVFACMETLGGQNYDTLFKCSCSIDRIADQVSYEEYLTMDTFRRGQQAGGERPELIREGSMASEYRRKYDKVKANAQEQCQITPTASNRR